VTADAVKAMKKEDAVEIYCAKYWNPMHCAEMPKGVDLAVFDFGVNSGNSRAIKFLQRVVGVTDDGSLGPITMAALSAADPHFVVQWLCADRLTFLQSLSTFPHFGKGWTRRVQEVEQTALKMIGG
jgi:lysozyme family protein